jgi:hypothetical protein
MQHRKRGKKKMAAKANRRHHRRNASHRRHHRRNPSVRNRRHYTHRRHRRNPLGGGFGSEVMSAFGIVAGAVLSRIGTQAILTTNNTGFIGYAANLLAGGLLAWITKSFMRNAKLAADVFKGAVVGVVLRVMTDYSIGGSFLQSAGLSGLGDLGAYIPTNAAQPQFLADPLRSAMVSPPSPAWWSAAPAAGMQGMYDFQGSGLYAGIGA